jgi:hypothetical protein
MTKKNNEARARGGGSPAGYGFVAVTLVLAWLGVLLTTEPSATPAASPGVVDSVFPIEEEIRRFRVGLPEVTELSEGAESIDELVGRFVKAVEHADTAALVPLLLTRAEFGWLYYPHTMYTAAPYKLSPALLWFQMQNLTDSGLARLFERARQGGLHVSGHRCEENPEKEGPNRVWSECRVIVHPPGAEPSEMQLFGSILERGGVYKFVTYAGAL